mmetsp:Transcript_18296/g.24786  ORF Transcript_18296/g.24786 Transcript_18296/m.24786 type:complete len:328 (-) Transcript_18296:308-1291(-)
MKDASMYPVNQTLGVSFWMGSWYLCSLTTLFLNKTILTELGSGLYILSMIQMTTTAVLGAVKVYMPGGVGTKLRQADSHFWRNLFIVGALRGATVVLGLIGLKHLSPSFTEAIKSSAPLITVVFAWLILNDRTAPIVLASLVPIMFGLLLTSMTDISFDQIGFIGAMACNCIDCVQNVFSKSLMKSLSPVQLQFMTSATAAAMQLPFMIAFHLRDIIDNPPSGRIFLLLLVAAVAYHLQSVTAYCTMDLVSPVTMSVANCAKRGLLIILSVLYFGNEVHMSTWIGMVMIILGVFWYNKARTLQRVEDKKAHDDGAVLPFTRKTNGSR